MRDQKDIWRQIGFDFGRWLFLAVVLALLPLGVSGLSAAIRNEPNFHFQQMYERGELLLVSAAVLGAAATELIARGHQRLGTLRLFVGLFAGAIAIAASMWFADIAAGLRDEAQLNGHRIAVWSSYVFLGAAVTSVSCLVVSGYSRSEE